MFLIDDFSVRYVAQNSNTLLPLDIKLVQCGGLMRDLSALDAGFRRLDSWCSISRLEDLSKI